MNQPITLSALRKHGKRIDNPVLAEGEATGHAHRLATMKGVERYEMNSRRYLVVLAESGVGIDHEEHGVGTIDPEIYEERIDREYDYVAEIARNVVD